MRIIPVVLATWLCALLICGLGGCSYDDAIARAERAAEAAAHARADAEAGIVRAEELSAQLKALAKALDASQAARVIEQADALVASARAALPIADATLAGWNEALAEAKKAREAGTGWAGIIAAVLGTGGPIGVAAGAIIKGLTTQIRQRDAAIIATAQHADRMEEAEDDKDLANKKLISIAQQRALGVADLIAELRKQAATGKVV